MHPAVERLLRARSAVPLVLAAALAIVLASEYTYDRTRGAVAAGIRVADARNAAARCLQLLTDAETAQRGYLLTGQPSLLAPYEAARRDLPAVLEPTLDFVGRGSDANAAAAERVRLLIADKLAELGVTVSLYQSGRKDAALHVVASGVGALGMVRIRDALGVALARAADEQRQARTTIVDMLVFNRIVVATLTVLSVVALLLFLRQRSTADGERARHQLELESQVEARTADLRELATHLQTAREDERARLARDLHDEMGGALAALKIDLLRLLKGGEMAAPAAAKLVDMGHRIDHVIALKRRVIEDLHPSALGLLGLKAALGALCDDAARSLGVPVERTLEDVQLGSTARLTVYRLVQESLTNIAKYAEAQSVRVRLQQRNGRVRVDVRDDGRGFDVDAADVGRHGLAGMRYRVESHGGRMDIVSSPGKGTLLSAELPLHGD